MILNSKQRTGSLLTVFTASILNDVSNDHPIKTRQWNICFHLSLTTITKIYITFRVRSFGVIRVRISDPRSVWIMVHQRNRRVRSFGVIRVRISDPRSVWIMVHQRNRRIHSGHGFAGSFGAPWSRQILDHWSELGSPQRNAPLDYCYSVCGETRIRVHYLLMFLW